NRESACELEGARTDQSARENEVRGLRPLESFGDEKLVLGLDREVLANHRGVLVLDRFGHREGEHDARSRRALRGHLVVKSPARLLVHLPADGGEHPLRVDQQVEASVVDQSERLLGRRGWLGAAWWDLHLHTGLLCKELERLPGTPVSLPPHCLFKHAPTVRDRGDTCKPSRKRLPLRMHRGATAG